MFHDFYKNKRVLVTGHTGFKGAWLCQWLLDLGAEVAGISIDVPTQPSLFDVIALKQRMKHYLGDIRGVGKTQGIFQEFKPDLVFHMAAQSQVLTSYDEPKNTFDTNVGGTVNVLEAIRNTPSTQAALIVTSDKCYENVDQDYAFKETDRLGGKDPYSASKACAEIVFHSYFQSFFQSKSSTLLASARAGNVVGGGDWAQYRIIPDCVRSWSQGKPVSIRSPDATRPWQHVLEPLSGYLWLVALLSKKSKELNGQSFNFGPEKDGSKKVSELIDEVKKTWTTGKWNSDPQLDSKVSDRKKKEAQLLMLNCEKAKNVLNWSSSLSFEDLSRMTAEWYLAYQKDPSQALSVTQAQIRDYERKASAQKKAWAISP